MARGERLKKPYTSFIVCLSQRTKSRYIPFQSLRPAWTCLTARSYSVLHSLNRIPLPCSQAEGYLFDFIPTLKSKGNPRPYRQERSAQNPAEKAGFCLPQVWKKQSPHANVFAPAKSGVIYCGSILFPKTLPADTCGEGGCLSRSYEAFCRIRLIP